MHAARAWLPRPALRSRVAAGALTLLALVPLLLRLPRVSVVACFDVGHPLYQWVPSTAAHCLSAPTAAVAWTLMVASTLVVQVVLLPLLLAAGALLLRAARSVAASALRLLESALLQLSAVLVPRPRLVPVQVRTGYPGVDRSRENPRRGPPSRLS